MRILLAPNALKGSLSAVDFVRAIQPVLQKKHTVQSFCLSDGGDGFLEFFSYLYPQARRKYGVAKDAFLQNHRVPFLFLPEKKIAVLETAKICGLGNTPKNKLDVLHASSYGVGQMLHKAVKAGAKTIYVGLGGVACNDGGAGMAQACGAILKNRQNEVIPLGAQSLLQISRLDLSPLQKKFRGVKIIGVADVTNPLLGPKSSAKIFGPQKGADANQVKLLDKAMASWARAIFRSTKRSISHQPSTAAAGAIGAGLTGCFGAELWLGSDFLMQHTPLEQRIRHADFIITSEGKLDKQTFYGKAPLAVLQLAKKYKKRVLFICGQVEENALKKQPLAPQQIAVLTDFSKNERDAQTHPARYLRLIANALV